MEPLRGRGLIRATLTRGALRDPGLRYVTPSAYRPGNPAEQDEAQAAGGDGRPLVEFDLDRGQLPRLPPGVEPERVFPRLLLHRGVRGRGLGGVRGLRLHLPDLGRQLLPPRLELGPGQVA